MTDPRKIPLIFEPEVGPGSQPEQAGDEAFGYMSMPSSMEIYHQPQIPEPEDAGEIAAALAVLERAQQALAQHAQVGNSAFALTDLDEHNLGLINQVLGVGEVSATITATTQNDMTVQIQESVMAGVWRLRYFDQNEQLQWDGIEVGPIPACIHEQAFANARIRVNTHVDESTPGPLMNAPALLAELDEKLQQGAASDEAHVINLSLLPLSEADLYCLGERLGVGPVTLLSRGYGNCRIGSTACRDIWWIKYYNSDDALILNTIEYVSVPNVALAAPEDIEDSAHRLQEILEIYR